MLIIYSHPNKVGHCGYILKRLCELCTKKSIKYTLIDLYDIYYDPVLKPEEHYTSGNNNVSDQNKNFQDLIKTHEKFVFIYPTWWQNMPAVLKGFIDRVFIPGFSFKFKKKVPEKLLKHKKAVIITTTGSPIIVSKILFRSRSLKPLSRDVLSFCGFSVRGFILGSCRVLDENKKKQIDKIIKKTAKHLYDSKTSK